jgi:hypothetical protein
MNGIDTGSILISIVDGTRQPLSNAVKWSARIHDGRSPDDWQIYNVDGSGSSELIKGLHYFDNLFDDYTVVVNSANYEDAGWMPVRISPVKPAQVDLMLIPNDSHLNFNGADWDTLSAFRPRFAEILSAGITDAPQRYGDLIEQNEGLSLCCLLNLLTVMSQIVLPSSKSPLDYYWQPIWDSQQFAMAQDRFFAYVDKGLVDDVVIAAKTGAFSQEKNPEILHPGATLSYKQTQFDVTNLQLTFHQGNTKTIQSPSGPVDCIVVEPDIDYYKDLAAHFLLELVPNKFTGGLTDPRVVYQLRWIAGRQVGQEFNPLYTMTT